MKLPHPARTSLDNIPPARNTGHWMLPTTAASQHSGRPIPHSGTAWSWHRWRQEREQKQGKQAGIYAGLKGSPFKPPLPSLHVTNTQSILQKTYELRLRITTHTVNSCVLFFFKTWLNVDILEDGYWSQRAGLSIAQTEAESGKSNVVGCAYM